MPNPIEVKALEQFHIWLKFDDGTQGNIDLSHLRDQGVFRIWNDPAIFNRVQIDLESKAIVWNETVELCPDSLYLRLRDLTFEQWKETEYSYATNQ